MGTHDLSHKEFYSHPENVKDLLQGFVALDCVKEFDFNTLERENGSYVEKEKGERHDDIVWRLKWHDTWVYVYIIIEFQSEIDETMPIRIMSYVSLLLLSLYTNKKLDYGKNRKLPPVLPIVLYNGKETWNVAKNVRDMIETGAESMQKYVPNCSYYFIDETHPEANEKDTVGDGLANSVVASMKLQRSLGTSQLQEFLTELNQILRDENIKDKFKAFMVFLRRYLSLIYNDESFEKATELDEVINMTYSFRDRDREADEARGEARGELNAFYKLIKKGRLTIEEAAQDIGMSIDELLAGFKKYNLAL